MPNDKDAKPLVLNDPRKWVLNITLGTLSALAMAAWLVMQASKAWHYDTFVTLVQADQHAEDVLDEIAEVKKIAEENRAQIDEHIKEFRTANALAMLDRANAQLESYRREHNIDPNDETTHDSYYDALERRQRDAQAYVLCLSQDRTNCEHLRPRI